MPDSSIDPSLQVARDIVSDPNLLEHQLDLSMIGPAAREILSEHPSLAKAISKQAVGVSHSMYETAVNFLKADPNRVKIFKTLVNLV